MLEDAHSPRGDRTRKLARDQRGAVFVEFIVVFVPVMLLFLCIVELTRLSIASMMLQRSAGIAARACAVIVQQPLHCDRNVDDRTGQDPNQANEVLNAAIVALKPLKPDSLKVDAAPCTVGTDPTPQSGTDTATVRARFRCVVPIASSIVCSNTERAGSPLGEGSRTRAMTATARYAHQSARYDCWYSREVRLGLPGIWDSGQISAPEFF